MSSFRKFVSLSITFSFIIMTYTGIFLFISPKGRVAHWTNWELFGLSKDQYTDLHVTFMVLFIVGIALHLYLNWRPLMHYLQNKERNFSILTKEFAMAFGFALLFIFGTLYQIPPFKTFTDFEASVKNSWETKHNEAPIPHAELLSLKELCDKTNIDLNNAIARLQANGITNISANQPLATLAEKHHLAPVKLYQIITASTQTNTTKSQKSGGWGRMSLGEVCQSKNLDLERAVKILQDKGIQADKNSKIKPIANELGITPIELIKILTP
ncbi:DUF4405 domain-containing protein [Sulfurospirillum sp. 1612]|uniref:DUF4405 domain-containing protein n=1 Tax=Sulfurospirillum sp. 1612 TaxID=3094835 RepID=UPI002F943CA1